MLIAIALAGIGYIVEFLISIGWFWAPDKPFKNVFEAGVTGFAVLAVGGLVGMMLYHIFMFLFNAGRSAGTAIAHRFDDNYESCTLFEECEDER